jgi:hypothetical protein
VASQAAPPVDSNAEARRDYEQFEKVGTKEAWDAFLMLHTSGPYAELARAQRAKLAASSGQKTDVSQPKSTGQASQVIAALAPASPPDAAAPTPPAGPNARDTARMLQTELKRVGCYADAVNGDWSRVSQRALAAFNQNAGTRLQTNIATLDAVAAVRDSRDRVCPLTCSRGFRADGDHCVAITCDPGSAVGPSGTCEPVKDRPRAVEKAPAQTPKAQTPEPKRQATARPAASAPASRASAAPAQVACDRFGCQPVKRGCRMRTEDFRGETQQEVVCN